MDRSRQEVGVLWHLHLLVAIEFVAAWLSALRSRAFLLSPLNRRRNSPPASRLDWRPRRKVVAGDATLEIWLVDKLESSGGPGWSGVESGTLVGALRVGGTFKEIRGKVVKPGVYTLRYGQQPQNGDHLGISPFREFLLISPAAIDTDPKVLGFDGVVALSKEVIGTAHPASLSLDPPEDAPGAVLSTYKNESGHEGVVLQIGSRQVRFDSRQG